MKKVLSLTFPPMPMAQLDKLISTVIQDEGNESTLEWLINDEVGLDLYVDDG